jgi:hypothetical protein
MKKGSIKASKLAIPEGYFEFSLPQKYNGALNEWKEWFDKKNIKHITIQNHKKEYILCREMLNG